MKVKKVTEDSWIFQKPYEYTRGCEYGSDGEVDDEGIPLKLPKDVVKLGKKGMEISCMGLQCRRGVWSPFSPYGEGCICVNVYPA